MLTVTCQRTCCTLFGISKVIVRQVLRKLPLTKIVLAVEGFLGLKQEKLGVTKTIGWQIIARKCCCKIKFPLERTDSLFPHKNIIIILSHYNEPHNVHQFAIIPEQNFSQFLKPDRCIAQIERLSLLRSSQSSGQ